MTSDGVCFGGGHFVAEERMAGTGDLLKRQRFHNLYVPLGLQAVAHWFMGRMMEYPGFIAVGTGTDPGINIQNEVYSRGIDHKPTSGDGRVTLFVHIPEKDANGFTLTEVAVKDISGSFIYARSLFESPIVKTDAKTVTIFYEIDALIGPG